jgi:hypothetical protein
VVLTVPACSQTAAVWSAAEVVVVLVLTLSLLLGFTLLSAQPAAAARATVANAALMMSFRMGVTSPREAAPAGPALTRNGPDCSAITPPRHREHQR